MAGIPTGHSLPTIQTVFGEQRSRLRDGRGQIEDHDLSAARRPVHGVPVADEQRPLVASHDAPLVVPIAERSKGVAVRRAPTEPHLAVVPMAAGKPRLLGKRLSLQCLRLRSSSFPTARQHDTAHSAV